MTKKNSWRCAMVGAGALAGHGLSAAPAIGDVAASAPLGSGIDIQYFDDSVRAQDDFYRHVNGAWLNSVEIPADKARYGSFDKLNDDSIEQLRSVLERLQQSTDPADPDQKKIVDLYASFMDEPALERSGLKPLAGELARIAAIKSKAQIPGLMAHLGRIGVGAPYQPHVHQDARDATRYVFDLAQSGLGLPDRDYYLESEERLTQVRAKYLQHVETMLKLAGDAAAAQEAKDILALETALAKVQWTKVENRDPVKAYNRVELAQLPALAPGYDWKAYLSDAGVAGKVDYLVISQPSYITAFNQLLQRTPLSVWNAIFAGDCSANSRRI
jgi:putative endopeptidase